MAEESSSTNSSASTHDYQSEHAVAVLRRSVEVLEESSEGDCEPHQFLAELCDAGRRALGCEHYVLASRRTGEPQAEPTVIAPDDQNGEVFKALASVSLSELFDMTGKAADCTYARDVTGGTVTPILAAGLRAKLASDSQQRALALDMLIAIVGRPDPLPDPEFSEVSFLTYDQLFLRLLLLQCVLFIRAQYRARRQAFDEVAVALRLPSRLTAAKSLLDFESLIGCGVDLDVFETWLRDEKDAFVRGEFSETDFTRALEAAAGYRRHVSEDRAGEGLGGLLFECHLALLTKAGRPRLLSERLECARKRAEDRERL